MSIMVEFKQVDNLWVYLDDPDKEAMPGMGSFHLSQRDEWSSFIFICPCGCGDHRCIPIKEPINVDHGKNIWSWDGDLKRPTIKPSIRDTANCKWHGWLTDGRFTSC